MFDFALSDELKLKIKKLIQKDRRKVEILNKKIKEIIANDSSTIQRYKNLRREYFRDLNSIGIDG